MARLPKIVRPHGIKAKFILLVIVLMTAVFAVVTFVLVNRNTSTLRTNLLNESKAFSSLATKPIGDTFVIYDDSGRIRILQQIEKFTELNSNIINVAVVGGDGKILFSQKSEFDTADVPAQAAAGIDPTYIYDESGRLNQVIYPYQEDFGLRRYSVVYWISNASIDVAIRRVVESLILLGIAGTALGALLIYIFVNRFLLNPLKDVSTEALSISRGALDHQIKLARKDEIADLAESINSMANSLKADIQKLQEIDSLKTEFLMIASHNLRTPISIMEGNLELLRTMKPGQDVSKFVGAVSAGASRLKDFANDMLTISQIEAGHYDGNMEALPINPFIETTASEFKPLAEQKGLKFGYRAGPSNAIVTFNASYLRPAIWNVLDNALKFTPEGGKINLDVICEQKQVIIKVTDSGEGIDPKELPLLFTKFHRGTTTLEYKYEGTGLGLYLTKLIIDQHKGTINIVSNLGKGTTVAISLPATNL